VKGLKIEVPERRGGEVYSSRGGVPIAIHKELLSPRCGTANLRKVVQ
jgi:hypothetical protein